MEELASVKASQLKRTWQFEFQNYLRPVEDVKSMWRGQEYEARKTAY